MRYVVKAMALGEVLDQAVVLTKDHFKMLFGISCFLLVPLNLAHQFSIYAIAPGMLRGENPEQLANEGLGKLLLVLGINLVFVLLLVFVAMPLTNAALIRAVASEYLDRPTTAWRTFRETLGLLLPLIGTSLLAGLIVFAGSLACLIPGIYFALCYYLTTHTVVIEERAGWDALTRSHQLMKGNMVAAFVLGLLLGVIGVFAQLMGNMIPIIPIAIVVNSLVQGVLVALGAAAAVVFYFSCRCKHEDFDLTILASAVAQEETPGAQVPAAQ
ncbi:MAG: hypothetical protein NTW87_23305 [Planctomycetota bacterium]|nr:hypothetical protein [Planctomycetota bacterium]